MFKKYNIGKIVKFSYNISKKFFYLSITNALIETTLIYINLFCAAKILDNLAEKKNLKEIVTIVLLMIIANLILALCKAVIGKVKNICGKLMDYKLKEMVGMKTTTLRYDYIESSEVREMLVSANKGVQANGGIQFLSEDFSMLLKEIVTLVYSVLLCAQLAYKHKAKVYGIIERFMSSSWSLVIVISLISILIYLTFHNTKKLSGILDKAFQSNVKNNTLFSYYTEFMREYKYGKDIRLFQLGNLIDKRLLECDDNIEMNQRKQVKQTLSNGCINRLYEFIIEIIIYVFIGSKALIGIITLGELTLYIGAFKNVIDAIMNITRLYAWIPIKCQYMSYFIKYIEKEGQVAQVDRDKNIEKIKDIEFKNVYFKYPDSEEYILKNVSFKINENEIVTIVGVNGAGKSTIVKLICGLYEVTKGEILINGININKLDIRKYQQHIAALFQDFELFAYSIEENITLGKNGENVKMLEIFNALKIDKIINRFSDKEKTIISSEISQGVELSGGEKQKIALARAIYKDSSLLVMDEPTSALDPIAEEEILSDIVNVAHNKRMILYVSHRLSSCKESDMILVMNKGELVEVGNHQELINQKKEYYRLWSTQSQYYT